MSYKVIATDEFQKDVKKLYKKDSIDLSKLKFILQKINKL